MKFIQFFLKQRSENFIIGMGKPGRVRITDYEDAINVIGLCIILSVISEPEFICALQKVSALLIPNNRIKIFVPVPDFSIVILNTCQRIPVLQTERNFHYQGNNQNQKNGRKQVEKKFYGCTGLHSTNFSK